MVMNMNRRIFLASAAAAVAARPLLSAAQSGVTSGGIGLTLADVQSMYEELPPGQSFRSFTEPQTGTTLFIDFGDTDLAQSIWVSGELDEATATDLIPWLCPDDIVTERRFEILESVGSIVFRETLVLESPFLAGFDPERSRILVTYVVEPPAGKPSGPVKGLTLRVEQALTSGRG
jgi:hypothetical protein